MQRDTIFLSYSRTDAACREALVKHLDVVLGVPPSGRVFADTGIETGEEWRRRIQEELDRAAVIVFLVSAEFLGSEFVRTVELPRAALAARRGETRIAALYVKDCAAEEFRITVEGPDGEPFEVRLTDYQGINDPGAPVMAARGAKRERALKEAAEEIVRMAGMAPAPPDPDPDPDPTRRWPYWLGGGLLLAIAAWLVCELTGLCNGANGHVEVPQLIGLRVARARVTLRECGLVIEVSREEGPGLPGLVIAQEPAAGELVAQGARVRLTVRGGRESDSGNRGETDVDPDPPPKDRVELSALPSVGERLPPLRKRRVEQLGLVVEVKTDRVRDLPESEVGTIGSIEFSTPPVDGSVPRGTRVTFWIRQPLR